MFNLKIGPLIHQEKNLRFYNKEFKKVKRNITLSSFTGSNLDKGNFDHYMQKEIFEQPPIIGDSLSRFLDPVSYTHLTLPTIYSV